MNTRLLCTDRKKAGIRSRQWIESLTGSSKETNALQQLGLFFCEQIKQGDSLPPQDSEKVFFQLPAVKDIVCMDRADLLKMANNICLVAKNECRVDPLGKDTWARIFGGTALSFARVGDLPVVAALLRCAAHLGLNNAWLDEAERFLLDQQQPDGSFGLMAPELEMQKEDTNAYESRLRLTVEIVWAFAERASQPGSQFCQAIYTVQ